MIQAIRSPKRSVGWLAWSRGFEFFVRPHFPRKVHHKVPPNRERELWAVIFLDQRQRQVDPRSQARGSVKRAVLDQAAFVIDPQGLDNAGVDRWRSASV